ncbi:MAG: GDP-mannose 4,6-dehydratase [bacterium]|nr:GDP-mannose 4,6-dehydratase [bacterium]
MKKQPVAFITGITGQDGSYLTELLLAKGYTVHGLVRRNSILYNYERMELTPDFPRNKNLIMHYGDMTDAISITNILSTVRPDEIYNLAAQSHVKVSFETPLYTAQTCGIGVLNLLEAVRALKLNPKIYQASTSELYSGNPKEAPQNEITPFKPRSPYGVAKLYGFEIARVYRESYGMFISNGILFNHESERRGENFVTRKITLSIGDIVSGKEKYITLGNIDAKRDWGYAPEYVWAMWKMLQQDKPDDFVIATGETHSVKEFLIEACAVAGLDWKKILKINDKYKRPNEVDYLCGDASKAKRILGWKPQTTFKQLVKIMVKHDLKK